MRRRGGRKRQGGERFPCGKLRVEVMPKEALMRRAELAGCSTEEAKRGEAGYALGQLLMRGIIDQRQHDAGMAFARDWNRWALLAGLPPHQVRLPTGGGKPDADPDEWLKIRDRYLAACSALRRCPPHGLVWAAVEMVVMDEEARPIIDGLCGPQAIAALRNGLNALAKHYHISGRNAA